jgi:hypothetical protein
MGGGRRTLARRLARIPEPHPLHLFRPQGRPVKGASPLASGRPLSSLTRPAWPRLTPGPGTDDSRRPPWRCTSPSRSASRSRWTKRESSGGRTHPAHAHRSSAPSRANYAAAMWSSQGLLTNADRDLVRRVVADGSSGVIGRRSAGMTYQAEGSVIACDAHAARGMGRSSHAA